MLSRVVAVEKDGREEAEIEMTSLGEVVIEAWKAQHGQNAALTASARVIMPDHVHLLLIVNYDIDPHFDILDWLHHFRRDIEAKWVALAGRGAGAQPPSVVEIRPFGRRFKGTCGASAADLERFSAVGQGRPSGIPSQLPGNERSCCGDLHAGFVE